MWYVSRKITAHRKISREVTSQELLTSENWLSDNVDAHIAIAQEAASRRCRGERDTWPCEGGGEKNCTNSHKKRFFCGCWCNLFSPAPFLVHRSFASSWKTTYRESRGRAIKLTATASDSKEGGWRNTSWTNSVCPASSKIKLSFGKRTPPTKMVQLWNYAGVFLGYIRVALAKKKKHSLQDTKQNSLCKKKFVYLLVIFRHTSTGKVNHFSFSLIVVRHLLWCKETCQAYQNECTKE